MVRDGVDASDVNLIDAKIICGHMEQGVQGELGQNDLLPSNGTGRETVGIDQLPVVLDRRNLVRDIEERPEPVDVEGTDSADGPTLQDAFRPEAGEGSVLLQSDRQLRIHRISLPVGRENLIIVQDDLDRTIVI